MKLWIAAAPLLLLALWAGVRALGGRLSRRSANLAVALVLLFYALTTASLGVFWVARMDLPVFDWHYLFGYGLLLVLVVHVGLQLASVAAHLRRASPGWLLTRDGHRFRWPLRALATLLVLALLLTPALGWLLGRWMPAARIRLQGRPPQVTADPSAEGAPEIWIERGGTRTSVPDYLWSESRHSRVGVLRRPAVTPPRPASVRTAPGAKVLTLPQPLHRAAGLESDADRGARIAVGPGTRGASIATLSALLHHAYGVTRRSSDALSLRAAASAGALYPTDVFVLVRGAGELARGVHYYDPEAHALLTVGGPDAVERALTALPGRSPVASAELVVVLGATFDRTIFKYDARSYRYVALDAGHVAENLMVAGEALGLPCRLEPHFDDATLAHSVGLVRDGEGALLAVGCGVDRPPPSPTPTPTPTPKYGPVELPELADDLELTRLSHALTSWRLARRDPATPSPDAGLTPAAGPTRAHVDPLGLIRQRRSNRSFAQTSTAREDLDAALGAASRALGALGAPSLVDLFVSVRAVDGLTPGSYRFARELALLQPEPDIATRLQSVGLEQEVLGRAAFVVALTLANTAGQVDGPRDFRHALLQAGMAGQALYLEATARGLGACGVGAFFDDEVGELLRPGPTRPRALHLVAIGKK